MSCLRRDQGPPLTPERARELLAYNPESGALTWRNPPPGRKRGALAGTDSRGYAQVQLDQIFYKAHRLAWLIQTGEWPRHQIDHINGIRRDNRWCNLRDATPAENARNKRSSRRNKSGFRGVSWNRHRQKWDAAIGWNGRTIHVGCFANFDEACTARLRVERELYGAFARGGVDGT